MQSYNVLEEASKCIRNDPPVCSGRCPFGMDVKAFMQNLQKNNLRKAFNEYRKAVVFPEIVSQICNAPCEKVCFRKDVDEPVQIRALEQAVIQNVKTKKPAKYIPAKKEKILVVGAGLAGIGLAIRLAERGFRIDLIEQSSVPGGKLKEEYPDVFTDGCLNLLYQALDHKYISTTYSTRVDTLDGYDHDAVVLATGSEREPENAGKEIFRIGRAEDPSLSLAGALASALHQVGRIDAYARGVSYLALSEKESRYQPDTETWEKVPATLGKGGDYQEEVTREALRCKLCSCNACEDACEILRHYYPDPLHALNDINATIHKTEFNYKKAQPFINSCTLCGKCGIKCPQDIDFSQACLYTRQKLREKGSMPPVYHEYWINEASFSAGEEAALIKALPGQDEASWAFFPGCQLGGSDPEYVTRTFDLLKHIRKDPGAIFLRCCSVPFHWAGEEELFLKELEQIRKSYHQLGFPEMIVACPSCIEVFHIYLPEIKIKTLWNVLGEAIEEEILQPGEKMANSGGVLFDPCVAVREPESKSDARKLLRITGSSVEELFVDDESAGCCGYGGLIYLANRDLYRETVSTAANLSEKDYFTYCINCRDSFAQQRKRSIYILDPILFPEEDRSTRIPPTPTERRHNRMQVKTDLLNRFWGIAYEQKTDPETGYLSITPEVTKQMAELLLLEEDILRIVNQALKNRRMIKKDNQLYTCYQRVGTQTIHVDFKADLYGKYIITDVYVHRIVYIEREGEISESEYPDLCCCSCDRNLADSTANFEYLGNSFMHTLPVCPSCRQVYLNKELCETTILELEMMLEEK